MPGAGRGLDAEPFDGVQDDEAYDERGQLGVARLGELFDAGVEQQVLHVAAGDGAGVLHELPGGMVAPGPPHAWSLRPLSRENERRQAAALLRSSNILT